MDGYLVPVMIIVWLLLAITGHYRTPPQKLGMLWVGMVVVILSTTLMAIGYLLLGQPIILTKLFEFSVKDAEIARVSIRVTLLACPLVGIAGRGRIIILRRLAAWWGRRGSCFG